eukprot:3569796-Amphidinium_carterae.1
MDLRPGPWGHGPVARCECNRFGSNRFGSRTVPLGPLCGLLQLGLCRALGCAILPGWHHLPHVQETPGAGNRSWSGLLRTLEVLGLEAKRPSPTMQAFNTVRATGCSKEPLSFVGVISGNAAR